MSKNRRSLWPNVAHLHYVGYCVRLSRIALAGGDDGARTRDLMRDRHVITMGRC